MVEVRTATGRDRGTVARVLATAFAADPVIRWIVPSVRRDPLLFRAFVRHFHAAPGSTDLALSAGEPVGAALWDPPGHRPSARQQLLGDLLVRAAVGTQGHRRTALRAAFVTARPDRPVWYLAELGSSRAGQGAGTALLAHGLARITGPAYLESTNGANVPLYERFGFEVLQELALPDGGPSIWTMLRP